VQLRKAARFFVRTAMLRPGADHYTLLGLKPPLIRPRCAITTAC
jgi:hypothetical protein